MSSQHTITVPGYGEFTVQRRTGEVEMLIAIERDRLLRDYVQRNNTLNKQGAQLSLNDVSRDTSSFFSYIATFSQTVIKHPPAFNPHEFLTEWVTADVMDFITQYLVALGQLEDSFRRRMEDPAPEAGVESIDSADRDRVQSASRKRTAS